MRFINNLIYAKSTQCLTLLHTIEASTEYNSPSITKSFCRCANGIIIIRYTCAFAFVTIRTFFACVFGRKIALFHL